MDLDALARKSLWLSPTRDTGALAVVLTDLHLAFVTVAAAWSYSRTTRPLHVFWKKKQRRGLGLRARMTMTVEAEAKRRTRGTTTVLTRLSCDLYAPRNSVRSPCRKAFGALPEGLWDFSVPEAFLDEGRGSKVPTWVVCLEASLWWLLHHPSLWQGLFFVQITMMFQSIGCSSLLGEKIQADGNLPLPTCFGVSDYTRY